MVLHHCYAMPDTEVGWQVIVAVLLDNFLSVTQVLAQRAWY